MMVINNKYNIGDFVYLITDPDQYKRIVTGINVSFSGIMYEVSFGERETPHYEFELSDQINELIKVS
jgi:hypothetical protein